MADLYHAEESEYDPRVAVLFRIALAMVFTSISVYGYAAGWMVIAYPFAAIAGWSFCGAFVHAGVRFNI